MAKKELTAKVDNSTKKEAKKLGIIPDFSMQKLGIIPDFSMQKLGIIPVFSPKNQE